MNLVFPIVLSLILYLAQAALVHLWTGMTNWGGYRETPGELLTRRLIAVFWPVSITAGLCVLVYYLLRWTSRFMFRVVL